MSRGLKAAIAGGLIAVAVYVPIQVVAAKSSPINIDAPRGPLKQQGTPGFVVVVEDR